MNGRPGFKPGGGPLNRALHIRLDPRPLQGQAVNLKRPIGGAGQTDPAIQPVTQRPGEPRIVQRNPGGGIGQIGAELAGGIGQRLHDHAAARQGQRRNTQAGPGEVGQGEIAGPAIALGRIKLHIQRHRLHRGGGPGHGQQHRIAAVGANLTFQRDALRPTGRRNIRRARQRQRRRGDLQRRQAGGPSAVLFTLHHKLHIWAKEIAVIRGQQRGHVAAHIQRKTAPIRATVRVRHSRQAHSAGNPFGPIGGNRQIGGKVINRRGSGHCQCDRRPPGQIQQPGGNAIGGFGQRQVQPHDPGDVGIAAGQRKLPSLIPDPVGQQFCGAFAIGQGDFAGDHQIDLFPQQRRPKGDLCGIQGFYIH